MKLFPALGRSIPDFLADISIFRRDDVAEINNIQKRLGTKAVYYTPAGNTGAGEDDLIAYDVPSGILKDDGAGLEFDCAFSFAANGNNKRVRIYFGATLVYDSGAQAQNGGSLVAKVTVIRTGLATEQIYATVNASGTLFDDSAVFLAATEDLNAPVVIKATGEATANNDVVQQVFIFRSIPAS